MSCQFAGGHLGFSRRYHIPGFVNNNTHPNRVCDVKFKKIMLNNTCL